jgi:hypothetical protein
MSTSQFELIVDQVKQLPPVDLVRLMRYTLDLLEQNQVTSQKPVRSYASFFGSGKGAFNNSSEADAFIRSEREQWDE